MKVCALIEAGQAAHRNPLLSPLADALAARGATLTTFDVTEPWSPADVPLVDRYLVKGDHPATLAAAGIAADTGGRCLNDLAATARVADKARVAALLHRAAVPVPDTVVAADAAAAAAVIASTGPRFVKPLHGAHGHGTGIVAPGQRPPGDGPMLVCEIVDGPGYDYKVYGVGDHVAVRTTRPQPGRVDTARHPVVDPDPAVVRTAVAAARACELTCWGVDVLAASDGPVVVDVNAFPGYRSVPWAARRIADVAVAATGSGW